LNYNLNQGGPIRLCDWKIGAEELAASHRDPGFDTSQSARATIGGNEKHDGRQGPGRRHERQPRLAASINAVLFIGNNLTLERIGNKSLRRPNYANTPFDSAAIASSAFLGPLGIGTQHGCRVVSDK
jgi:hypothetical protein